MKVAGGEIFYFVIQDIPHVGRPAKKDFWKVVVLHLGVAYHPAIRLPLGLYIIIVYYAPWVI